MRGWSRATYIEILSDRRWALHRKVRSVRQANFPLRVVIFALQTIYVVFAWFSDLQKRLVKTVT